MIAFSEIFSRAIALFDDPEISKAYTVNQIRFQKMMRPYLVVAAGSITNPVKISSVLSQQTPASGRMEVFEGTGVAEYSTQLVPAEGAIWFFQIAGVPDYGAVFSMQTQQVVFSRAVAAGEEATAEWYYAGDFSANFANIFSAFDYTAIIERIKNLMSYGTLLAWSEKQVNFLIEIRNVLNDTDFNIHSPAAATHSRVAWHDSLRKKFDMIMTKLTWDTYVLGRRWR